MNPEWLLVLPAYLLGTFPTAILVGRREGRDLTQEGSGNPGASNTYRTLGRRAGATVLLGDASKGALAAGMGLATGNRAVGVACGLAAVLGHVAPVTRRFRGGKGVATGAGAIVLLLPVPALGLAVVWFRGGGMLLPVGLGSCRCWVPQVGSRRWRRSRRRRRRAAC